jgi:hypothetical protein
MLSGTTEGIMKRWLSPCGLITQHSLPETTHILPSTSLEPFTQPQMKLFSGKLVVIVQSSKQKGDIILKVKDSKRNIEKSITLQAI